MKFKSQRQDEADVRQELRDERSPREQLAVLDLKLGAEVGAQKERSKLKREMVSK